MSREIKAIQCPKCGSTKKVEIRPDYYKCTNCDTEYYLDNDDITITHNVNYNTAGISDAAKKKSAMIFFSVFMAVVIGIFLIVSLTQTTPTTTVKSTDKTEDYNWSDRDITAFADKSGQPVMVILGQRNIDGGDSPKSGKYAVFYDFLSGKEIKVQRLENIPKANNESVLFKTFENGDTYAIVNKSTVLKLNKSAMNMQAATSIFANHTELSAGIANIEFVSRDYGDGFNILTNDGKNYSLFPIIGRLYDKEQRRQAEKDLAVKDPTAKTKTYFDFSLDDPNYSDEKIKLMQFVLKDNLGGPNDWPYFEVRNYTDYNGRTAKTDFRGGSDLVISYKDLTPGRLYFSPKVLYYDPEYVLISMHVTAASESNTSLQCLDAVTGKVVFTLPFQEEVYFDEYAMRYKGGFVLITNVSVIAVGMDGKLIKEFKIF